MFCPVIGLLALAFVDNAFKESGIKKPEDLFSLEIPHFKEPLAIQWRLEIMESPIFHRQVNGDICNSIPWTFSDFNYSLKRLGFLSEYSQELSNYVLRRGAANAIDCKVIPGEVRRDGHC